MNRTPEQELWLHTYQTSPSTSIIGIAVAGSGKTTTIEQMVCEAPPPPGPGLTLAFNKRIQEELARRLPPFYTCLTFNGLGHRAWAATTGLRLTLDRDKMFKIVKELSGGARRGDDGEPDTFTEVLWLARKAKSSGLVPRGAPMGKTGIVPDDEEAWKNFAFEQGFDLTDENLTLARQAVLQSIKQSYAGVIDFDDQIYMSVLFGGVFPKYHTVIVDESQDLSPLNHEQLLRSVRTRAIIVGDPAQAIYGFRGADANSMASLEYRLGQRQGEVKTLFLTNSFRVPQVVAGRQVEWVPHFKAFETNGVGRVEHWPDKMAAADKAYAEGADPYVAGNDCVSWSLSAIPPSGFILCRNNAPLFKLAFALIKQRRPVKVLGRDIGKSLATLLRKVCSKKDLPIGDALAAVQEWKLKELAKVPDSESKQEVIHDRAESLEVLIEASGATSSEGAARFIETLFSDDAEGLTLSSIHRIKGLESPWVMHLDPWRCPSKMAERAAKRGDMSALVQENNLRYVAETRTLDVLVLANLEDCLEVGG